MSIRQNILALRGNCLNTIKLEWSVLTSQPIKFIKLSVKLRQDNSITLMKISHLTRQFLSRIKLKFVNSEASLENVANLQRQGDRESKNEPWLQKTIILHLKLKGTCMDPSCPQQQLLLRLISSTNRAICNTQHLNLETRQEENNKIKQMLSQMTPVLPIRCHKGLILEVSHLWDSLAILSKDPYNQN